MSTPPKLRRSDKIMSEETTTETLSRGTCGRLATVGPDGYPYCVPLLYVLLDGTIYVHNARARGHLRNNVEHEPRVCFEVDEPGDVFDYGRFECDTSIAYRSVIVFGRISVIDDEATKRLFCDALLTKYGTEDSGRLKGFYPRLDQITVYAITVERMTGKETPLPAIAERWPAQDHTKSANAQP